MPDGAQPSRSDRGGTAARLRQAARDVFASLGYGATRVEDITQRAGVSHGTFYTYFENKPAILESLVREAAERVAKVAAAPWSGPDAASAIHAVIGEFLSVYAEEADVIEAWLDAAAGDDRFAELLAEVRAEYVARVADNVAPVVRHRSHDVTVAASALVAMVEGYAVARFAEADPGERQAAVRTLTALWVGGLGALAADPGTEQDGQEA